jgi:hypothetical protein
LEEEAQRRRTNPVRKGWNFVCLRKLFGVPIKKGKPSQRRIA